MAAIAECSICVFARTGEAPGAKGLSVFIVPADYAGLGNFAERWKWLHRIRCHGLAFNDLPDSRHQRMIGDPAMAPYCMRLLGRIPLHCCSARTRLCPAGTGREFGPCQLTANCSGADERSCKCCRVTLPYGA